MFPVAAITYLPQQSPFQFVDELLQVEADHLCTRFMPRSNHVLVEEGKLTAGGLIENMAQSVAASMGYLAAQQNEAPPIGFLGAVKHLQIVRLPDAGRMIQTEASIIFRLSNSIRAEARIYQDEVCIASAELTIFVGPQTLP